MTAAHPVSIEWQTKQGDLRRIRGSTRDIARGGIYCFLERSLPLGLPVEFDIVMPAQLAGGHPLKLRCRGKILRSEPIEEQGYGVAVAIDQSLVLETLDPQTDASRQRLYARIAPASTIVAEYPGMRSVVRDLSLAGAFIEDERPYPVGRLFALRLSSANGAREIELQAIVRRVEAHVGMAVEFITLSKKARSGLEEIIEQGSPWTSTEMAFSSSPWQSGEPPAAAVTLAAAKDFLAQRAACALPQVEVRGCFYRAGDKLFSLHLRDPLSKAELLLPIGELWVQECFTGGDCTHVDRALGSAARFFDLYQPTPPKTD